jgi:hypothetical protein
MKRSLLSFVLISTALVLAGCNGTVSSVSFPAGSPWEAMGTGILSPTDDLVAVSTGAGVESELVPGLAISGAQAVVACQGASGPYFELCDDRACNAQEKCGTDTVISKRYAYTLLAQLDRQVFTTGSIQIQNGSGATQMGLAINAANAGGSFDVAAGFSEGMIEGIQLGSTSQLDEVGSLALQPHWENYGPGEILGQVCVGGVCSPGTVAVCDTDSSTDVLGYLTVAQPGTYSGTCGTIPVNLTINPVYSSVGACISARKATCNGLTGQAKKTCNHAQIGVCQATFNVPSALAR